VGVMNWLMRKMLEEIEELYFSGIKLSKAIEIVKAKYIVQRG
jgi:hypothetical protein